MSRTRGPATSGTTAKAQRSFARAGVYGPSTSVDTERGGSFAHAMFLKIGADGPSSYALGHPGVDEPPMHTMMVGSLYQNSLQIFCWQDGGLRTALKDKAFVLQTLLQGVNHGSLHQY